MGLFRTKPTPAFGASQVKAAAGSVIPGPVQTFVVGAGTARALSIPTISRARDLIVSAIAGLDLRQYTLQWTGENYERVYIPGESWFTRPDPRVPRSFIMAQTVQDLIMHGRSFWYVVERYSTGFPSSFVHLPYDNVTTMDQAGPEWFGPSYQVQFNGQPLKTDDVVQFLAPINGLLWVGSRSIDIAYRLHWLADEPFPTRLARCVATRLGNGGQPGQPRPGPNVRKFMVEFLGGPLAELPMGQLPEAVLTASRGTFSYIFTLPRPQSPTGSTQALGRLSYFTPSR